MVTVFFIFLYAHSLRSNLDLNYVFLIRFFLIEFNATTRPGLHSDNVFAYEIDTIENGLSASDLVNNFYDGDQGRERCLVKRAHQKND